MSSNERVKVGPVNYSIELGKDGCKNVPREICVFQLGNARLNLAGAVTIEYMQEKVSSGCEQRRVN